LEFTKTKLNRILMASLIFSTISSVISGVSTAVLTVDNPSYKTAGLVINGVIFCLSCVLTLLTGIIKIYKLDEHTTSYSTYIERIDQLYSKISSELVLPASLREDAAVFIKRENDNYLALIMQNPEIDASLYSEGIKKYTEFLSDNNTNLKFSQMNKNNDSIIEII
jgi:hypothetical protein